jgi:Multicopper oxidase
MGSVTIAFDADNPGRWAFHCHNLYHMMTGMMTEVRYPAIIRAARRPITCLRTGHARILDVCR